MTEYEKAILELQIQGQEFVDTCGNDYSKNSDYDKIEEENSDFNCLCNVDYNKDTHEELILAFHDDAGKIGKLQQEVIDKNFDSRQVWKHATTLRKQMCEMQREQLVNMIMKGMSLKQATVQIDSLGTGFNICAFLFDGSRNDIRWNDGERKRLFAQFNWSYLFEQKVFEITESQAFLKVWEEINEKEMDEAIYLPRPRNDSRIERRMHIIKSIVSTFAAIRMMRDNISAKIARDIVMKCKGINARVFFG
jgi:hypothetical protein